MAAAAPAGSQGHHHLGHIDPERFSKHFGDAPIINVSGRSHPVEIRYRAVELDEGRDGRGGRTGGDSFCC
jgi:ATP-dependent helicase HrpA